MHCRAVNAHIRPLIRRDFEELLKIEEMSFHDPWDEKTLLLFMKQRNSVGYVAELGSEVVGFMLYELHKQEIKLISIAVLPRLRRRDVGGQMLERLKSKLSSHRRTHLSAMVRETALGA
jgi:ribosomal-protein-alanine N-acetyltransferase